MSLTHHLLTHLSYTTAFKNATQSPFLSHAGKGTLPKLALEKWLEQDRLYVLAYIDFATSLLAAIESDFPDGASKSKGEKDEDGEEKEGLKTRLIQLLKEAHAGVVRELAFFEDVASRLNLNLHIGSEDTIAGPGVLQYRLLFDTYKNDILKGLLVLWATEKCYLEAWRYAASFLGESEGGHEDADGGSLRREFIPNWTGDEFVAFVWRCEEGLEGVWGVEKDKEGGKMREMEEIWGRVLDVERVFWPDV